MRFSQLTAIVGCTTAALVAIAPVQAEAATFQVQSGVTSVYHDLNFLSSIGLNLTGTNNTVEPITSNFLVGFDILPDTNFTFSDVGGFTPLAGTIKHSGTVTFNNQITVGNFVIDFESTRSVNNTSGLVLRDTVSLNTVLFDLSIPEPVAFDSKNLTIANVKLLISPEFASILGNPNLTGVLGGTARIDAQVVPVAAVPEPATVPAILAGGVALLATKRVTKLRKSAD
ncbi:PEP-CTERM sorting domain-containing protein [Tolypothrix sp. PCC 7910]|uniref:PEP-CTERM sorting domain-containing protein n=1 Tax=Tolypothrix sp. PCC 7910 TaxID=2099387 RepID=UPI00142782F8|nr:PEP-CTERM sorting domain-containing protein [Tolypothrix sp. PCC 7910]QIR36806.1 PEP-CTERM sorting domain-containing protein [Tolypothrix sp. PCC 7910]